MLKRDPVLGGYDPAEYATERLWAPARDGTRFPCPSSTKRIQEGRHRRAAAVRHYGMLPACPPTRPSPCPSQPLLDRGLVYAIAHIRGGQEMGRAWYDDGHLLKKKNSFTDFIDVTRYLVKEGYAAPGRVARAAAAPAAC